MSEYLLLKPQDEVFTSELCLYEANLCIPVAMMGACGISLKCGVCQDEYDAYIGSAEVSRDVNGNVTYLPATVTIPMGRPKLCQFVSKYPSPRLV